MIQLLTLAISPFSIIGVRGNIEDVSGSRTDFNEKDHATDGAASAKLNLFELCRVATEEG